MNATLLSSLYLAGAALIELALSRWPGGTLLRLAHSLDYFPVRFLKPLGLLDPLQSAYAQGELSDVTARVILGAVTVAFIYALSLLVGGLMWGVRAAIERRAASR